MVAGCDEVGRGSLAGPVSVGVVIIHAGTAVELPGVKDSKLLRPAVREALVPAILDWAAASAVGHAAPMKLIRWAWSAPCGWPEPVPWPRRPPC